MQGYDKEMYLEGLSRGALYTSSKTRFEKLIDSEHVDQPHGLIHRHTRIYPQQQTINRKRYWMLSPILVYSHVRIHRTCDVRGAIFGCVVRSCLSPTVRAACFLGTLVSLLSLCRMLCKISAIYLFLRRSLHSSCSTTACMPL